MAEGRFLTGPTMGHVVRMTLTGAAGITFVFLVDAANLFWISWLGQPVLMAAIGFAFAIQFFTVSIGVGMMIACTALVARSIGRGEHELARAQGAAGLLVTFVVQCITAGLIVLFRVPLLELLGAEGETMRHAARYLALSIPSLTIMAVGLCGSAVLRAHGDGRRAMFVTLFSGAVMMIIDPLLIYVAGWGLDGAALSVWIFRVMMAVLALYYCIRVHNMLGRPTKATVRAFLVPFAAIAVPAILTQMATPFGNAVLTGVIATHGDTAVAAWSVVNRLTVVAFGGLFALSGAIGGIFGQNFGAERFDRVRSTYRDAALFCLGYAGVMWLLLMAASGQIAVGFGLDPEGTSVLRAFTHIGALSFTLGGLLFVSNAAFNTLGRPRRASLLSWLREGVLMAPAALWFSASFGAVGVIYAQAAVGAGMGMLAGLLGWAYVARIGQDLRPELDLSERRAYRDVNRYRRR